MKKEHYINQSNIKKWKGSIGNYKSRKRITNYSIKNTALLVLDMQEFFLKKEQHAFIPDGLTIINNIKSVITLFRKYNSPIIFTKHALRSNNISDIQHKWWKKPLVEDNPAIKIVDDFVIQDDIVITKEKYSAFKNTNLLQILKQKKISSLVITGVMTHLCCETTARDGFMEDFWINFLMDGVATYNEQLHEAALITLSHGFASIISTHDYISEQTLDNSRFNYRSI